MNTLGHKDAAGLIWEAIRSAVAEGQVTADLGGSLNTRGVGEFLCKKVSELAKQGV